ncbi:alpha/beta-hydrolase [Cryphonectria parasitica EP155]|uniref:Alpha/beta-hydrolase n=1 Tax=Cryphonectria parasitica (strain ATCC 38755 / EP155) TaxID=660469 RepID=A0A9P5CRU4_CRYP1|nr:alpha/beta-hydrolase [Cryphonectria parasitica EP155]KAF3768934.1 alpha/beta-hydrolase [Cryphonectria parasitica EP155]
MSFQFSTDESFHFEVIRALGLSAYGGSDVSEVLYTIPQIKTGDFESWVAAWSKRAERTLENARKAKNPVSIRDHLFRAATYFRTAEFYLHGNWEDPRINELWNKNVDCFSKAITYLPVPGEKKVLSADGFQVPIYWFRPSPDDSVKRPTLMLFIGFDSGPEEMIHMHGFPALERGYNVVCLEGPGQGSVRRGQGLGFTHEWEKVVTPVVDFLETQPSVDKTKIALCGLSMGGFLSARAAAFEHRIAALICDDAVHDFDDFSESSYLEKFNIKDDPESIQAFINDNSQPMGPRWLLAHGMWSYKVKTLAELGKGWAKMSMAGLTDKIQCPVFLGDAVGDLFFKDGGHAQKMAEGLGDKATVYKFTAEDGADLHCQEGALRFANQVMFDWLDEKLGVN